MPYVNREENFLDSLRGQSNDYATPDYLQTLPDQENENAVAAANLKYNQDLAKYQQDVQFLAGETMRAFHDNPFGDEFKRLKGQLEFMGRPENQPQKPDPVAIEAQANRNRLLQQASGQQQAQINDLFSASRGQGPSAALNYYKEAADDAARRNYGLAASAHGTGGQRAALFQAAIGQEAMDRQKAAMKAAQIGAEEQNAARAQLNAALGSQTDVYRYLAGDTSHVRDVNQGAAAQATNVNRAIAQGNEEGAENFNKGLVKTGARLTSDVATGGGAEAYWNTAGSG